MEVGDKTLSKRDNGKVSILPIKDKAALTLTEFEWEKEKTNKFQSVYLCIVLLIMYSFVVSAFVLIAERFESNYWAGCLLSIALVFFSPGIRYVVHNWNATSFNTSIPLLLIKGLVVSLLPLLVATIGADVFSTAFFSAMVTTMVIVWPDKKIFVK